jgi:hypothetical protein
MNQRPCQIMASFFMVSILVACANMYECEHWRAYLDHEAHGTVTEKSIDTANHMRPIIVYQTFNGRRGSDDQIGIWIPDAYNIIEIGDEINKSSGSSGVTITKKGREIKFDTTRTTRRNWCR